LKCKYSGGAELCGEREYVKSSIAILESLVS